MSKNIYIIIVVGIIALGGFLFLRSGDTPELSTLPPLENEEVQSSATVTYTDSGYLPREVTIFKGGTVTFKNESSREMWTATAIHPTHTIYPGSSIQKCDTKDAKEMFDTCKGVLSGEEWSFQFNEQGAFGYHDHLQIRYTGRITVE